MARFFKHTLAICCLLLTACQEGGEAGDLFGQWRLTETSIHDSQQTVDNTYLSFSGSIALFRCPGKNEVFAKFQRSADSLFIQCTSIYGSPADTAFVEQVFHMKPFTDIRVKVDAIGGERLAISQGERQWLFRKY